MLKNKEIFEKMNELGASKTPFFFMIDFQKNKGEVIELLDLPKDIFIQIDAKPEEFNGQIDFQKNPMDFETYSNQFDHVLQNILRGNSFLMNLTCETPISTNLTLDEIFNYSQAKYKLQYRDEFVCFSPETFVKIKDGKIFSYPMKGTIDASIENAEEFILHDPKEKAEHYTIVDLIRNDLSKVAKKVTVEKFRFIDKVQTHHKTLLQVSSEISGELPSEFHHNLGDLFDQLLPAGSICGAPKEKTVEIILEAESYNRNFYTGVFGIFDGENLDSAVMIRFIEQSENGLVFKSGGGITHQSDVQEEYNEMISKVYVPIY